MNGNTIKLLLAALNEELEHANQKGKSHSDRLGAWCSREQAIHYFSLPKGKLETWVKEGKVVAKKFDPTDPNSTIRFNTADINAAYEAMPNYRFETKRPTGKRTKEQSNEN